MGPAVVVSLVALVSLVPLVGCDRVGAPAPVVVTNVVEAVRTVTVTNAVTVTNVVVGRTELVLSARRTEPCVISSSSMDPARLRRLLSDSGVRVIDCSVGSVALVEASEKSVAALRPVAWVKTLEPDDKVAPDAGERVCVTPLSTIDVAAVVKAVRDLNGEVTQVVTVGHPLIRAKMSYSAIHKLAARGDVRKIERDGK